MILLLIKLKIRKLKSKTKLSSNWRNDKNKFVRVLKTWLNITEQLSKDRSFLLSRKRLQRIYNNDKRSHAIFRKKRNFLRTMTRRIILNYFIEIFKIKNSLIFSLKILITKIDAIISLIIISRAFLFFVTIEKTLTVWDFESVLIFK